MAHGTSEKQVEDVLVSFYLLPEFPQFIFEAMESVIVEDFSSSGGVGVRGREESLFDVFVLAQITPRIF